LLEWALLAQGNKRIFTLSSPTYLSDQAQTARAGINDASGSNKLAHYALGKLTCTLPKIVDVFDPNADSRVEFL
jgi:hypothetical protein